MLKGGNVVGRTKQLDVHFKSAHQKEKRTQANLAHIAKDKNIEDIFTRALANKELVEVKRKVLFGEDK
eukprot:snap_masked-scaffold_9-processed-gene-6.12-mRNA-1 protein AED:1.00 eAED:1.00 QI:0/-1/0/0/-1/1/1/0/67